MEESAATSDAKAAQSAMEAAQQRVDDLMRQLEESEQRRARMADEVRARSTTAQSFGVDLVVSCSHFVCIPISNLETRVSTR